MDEVGLKAIRRSFIILEGYVKQWTSITIMIMMMSRYYLSYSLRC